MMAPLTVGRVRSGMGVATPRGSRSTTPSVAGRWPTQVYIHRRHSNWRFTTFVIVKSVLNIAKFVMRGCNLGFCARIRGDFAMKLSISNSWF